ncbi:hypothetical protein NFI96_023647 [Prochilodus magdalenae]|nr:hypothetical protein NFI96_023647 [Prochilodus magdalenae]
MQAENVFAKKVHTLNRNMGPPISNVQKTPVVPKMGVRARVSDWPLRKDNSHGTTYDNLITNFHNRVSSQDIDQDVINQNEVSLDKTRFLTTKYGLPSHSPDEDFHPLQKRSNSDITISDVGAEDGAVDQGAINPNTGASLHRDYGSTSSIDLQGLSGEVVFTTERTFPTKHSEQPSAPYLHGFPDYLQKDTISQSLKTAAQMAQGDLVCIPNHSDYVDNSLFYSQAEDRSFLQRPKSGKRVTSIFHKLKTMKSEPKHLTEQDDCSRHGCSLSFQRCFAHHDVQSVLFNLREAVTNRSNLAHRKNITTGPSAASQHNVVGAGDSSGPLPVYSDSPIGSCEDLGQKACSDLDKGDGKSNDMVLSCPYFCNEVGGEGELRLGLTKTNSDSYSSGGESCTNKSTVSSHCTNAGVSVLELLRDNYSSLENYAVPHDFIKRYIIEHIDMGAYYYHKFFYNKEHHNYFGLDENLGPVSVSVRRERLEQSKEGVQYNYRIILRTSELTTLRGSILEDAVPSTAKHGSTRGLPLKEVLEYVVPELNVHCLRLATNSPKVSEQLLKLDQQGLSYQHKVGILCCQAGQKTEEEMYNNETGSPALEEFLDLLGQRVRLQGFTKYRAQLDNKNDSTGTHSVYTVYKDHELMFHVSTMLPYTPNNRQQLLRKRHIENDIVTVIFQEDGALPFTPKSIQSHFQHVFIIVKVHNPCTEHVCYSVAVARSKDVPAFGPPIPKGIMFPKSAVFRDFLLAKMINGDNAAHKSEKFRAMATRTRQEYLKDLTENFASATPVDSSAAKFSFITAGAKKKERSRPRVNAHLHSTGAITWTVVAQDYSQFMDVHCLLAISAEFVVLIEEFSKDVVFNCYCRDVIGWSSSPAIGRVKLFYGRGDCVVVSVQDGCAGEVREVIQRLEMVTKGCETVEMVLRRNALGQLGFHVNFEGVVADVEPFGFAWQAGLRPGSRLVEVCKVTVATLSHEQMIELLRTSTNVSVVVVQPHDDGTPRRADSETHFPVVEYTAASAGAGWHCMMHVPQSLPLSRMSPTQGADGPPCGQHMYQYAAISRSTSFDKKYDGTSGKFAYRWIVDRVDLWSNHKQPGAEHSENSGDDSGLQEKPPTLLELTNLRRTVMTMESYKFLGTSITKDLKWNIYFLHKLRRFSFSQELIVQFYTATIESVIGTSISRGSSNTKHVHRLLCIIRILHDFERSQSLSGNPGQPYCSSPSNQSVSSDPGSCHIWSQKAGYDGCQSPAFPKHAEGKETEGCREPRMQTRVSEAKWHISPTMMLNKGMQRQEIKDLSNKFPLVLGDDCVEGGAEVNEEQPCIPVLVLQMSQAQTQEKNCRSHCSSHSGSNTLSSNTSSSSDDQHFALRDPMDTETLALTYLKGASTDSGIDATPCMPVLPLSSLTIPEGDPVALMLKTGRGQTGLPWSLEGQEEEEREGHRKKTFLTLGHVSASATGHATDGSIGDLSENSSLSSGSRHSGSPFEHDAKSSHSMDSKVYNITRINTTKGGGLDKCEYGHKSQNRKYPVDWKMGESGLLIALQEKPENRGQINMTDLSQLVGADKKIRTLPKEGLFKIPLPDILPDPVGFDKMSSVGQSSHRSLFRTLSDESLYSRHRKALSLASLRNSILEQVLPNDILFSSALPYYSTLPSSSGFSHKTGQFKEHTVASVCFLNEEEQNKQVLEISERQNKRAAEDSALEAGDVSPTHLSGKVNQLELILRQLQSDLIKEQQDKAMLQQQVQHLRQDNLRLHEESQTAAAQLQRFTEWFLNSDDKKA